jgi:hypothetical protein
MGAARRKTIPIARRGDSISSGGTLEGGIMMKSAVVIVVEIVAHGLGGFVKSKQSLRSS